jgi:uncharacterized protein
MTHPTERLQAMLAHACFGKDAEATFAGDLGAYLARHGVAEEDAAALLASPRRLGIYRRLVRHNVENVIGAMLERTRVRLEAHRRGAFDAEVAAFLDEVGPRTPHLRDVPREFLAFAAPRLAADPALPPWLVDHAQVELVEFTVGVLPRGQPQPALADIAADRPLVFLEARMLVRAAWAVHDMPDDPRSEPEERPVTLLVYRDAEHRTRFLDLTPLAAEILERLFRGAPLAVAMTEACAARGEPLTEAVLAGAARLLADLGERGVLLGARS